MRLASVALVLAIVAACTGQAAPSSAAASRASAPPLTTTARESANPCTPGLTLLEAFTHRLADDLAALRPLATAKIFDPAKTVDAIRRVSATMTTFSGLSASLQACDLTADLATLVDTLTVTVEKAVSGSLSVSVTAAQIQRDASVTLFGLLPKVLDLSVARTADRGSSLARSRDRPALRRRDQTHCSLAPLSTPRPTARPTTSSAWTQAAADTAVAWEQSVSSTYGGSLGSTLWDLAYLSSGGCVPGASEEECAAAKENGALISKSAYAILNPHVSFLDKNPAARCFQDAYKADRAVAMRYLGWLSAWGPWGGNETPMGQAQIYELRTIDTQLNAFLSKLNSYFSDCP